MHIRTGLGASYDLVGTICRGDGALASIAENSAWIDLAEDSISHVNQNGLGSRTHIFLSNARFDAKLQVSLESDLVLEPLQAKRPKQSREAVIDDVRYRDSWLHQTQALTPYVFMNPFLI